MLESRKWLVALAGINFCGFLFGVYYYWPQLSLTAQWLWPLVLDSPIAVLLFAATCVLLLARKGVPQLLLVFTFFALVKYGIWTVLAILLFAGPFFSAAPLIYAINLPGHALMVLEGLTLLRMIKPKGQHILLVASFFLLNDVSDYLFGTRPVLPSGEFDWLLAAVAFTATIILALLLVKIEKQRV